LVVFAGTDVDKGVVLQTRRATAEIKTSVNTSPQPASKIRPNLDVNITWLLQQLADGGIRPIFAINRTSKDCATPRRNPQVEAALTFMKSLHSWSANVHSYFLNTLFPVHVDHGLDLAPVRTGAGIFVPVLPFFEGKKELGLYLLEKGVTDEGLIPTIYSTSFLEEQLRSTRETFDALAKIYPINDKIITLVEAKILVIMCHLQRVGEAYSEAVNYVEIMLRKQLVAAIGTEVTPVDFANYLAFHNRKFFKSEYAPVLFSHAVRRPGHYPEGTLNIEASWMMGVFPCLFPQYALTASPDIL
jgi:hypothetical protein